MIPGDFPIIIGILGLLFAGMSVAAELPYWALTLGILSGLSIFLGMLRTLLCSREEEW